MKILIISLGFLLEILISTPLNAQTSILYAVGGAQNKPSNLYQINQTTGEATLIGSTGFSHVTGIAWHPISEILYGVTSQDELGGGSRNLIIINHSTGAGSIIGPTMFKSISDISFNSLGILYGWDAHGNDLLTINLATGKATKVGECSCGSPNKTGIAFDSNDNLYRKSNTNLILMDAGTGKNISSTGLTGVGVLHNILTFDENDLMFSGNRSGSGLNQFTLRMIELPSGAVSAIGTSAALAITGLAFAPVPSIPVFSQWAILLLGLIILNLGVVYLCRQEISYI